jgi:hypothetical protein
MPQVTIELARIGKPPRTYHEGFLSDNGVELRTLTILSPEKAGNHTIGYYVDIATPLKKKQWNIPAHGSDSRPVDHSRWLLQ